MDTEQQPINYYREETEGTKSKKGLFIIIGIVVGVIVLLALVGVGIFFLMGNSAKKADDPEQMEKKFGPEDSFEGMDKVGPTENIQGSSTKDWMEDVAICSIMGDTSDEFIGFATIRTTVSGSTTTENIIGRFDQSFNLKETLMSSVQKTVGETTIAADSDLSNHGYWCSELGGGKYFAVLLYSSSNTRYFKIYEWLDATTKTQLKNHFARKDVYYVNSFTKISELEVLLTTIETNSASNSQWMVTITEAAEGVELSAKYEDYNFQSGETHHEYVPDQVNYPAGFVEDVSEAGKFAAIQDGGITFWKKGLNTISGETVTTRLQYEDKQHKTAGVGALFFDSANGVIYAKRMTKSWALCKTTMDRLFYSECKNFPTAKEDNIVTITPFKDYDSKKMPYLMVRTDKVYVVDAMSFGSHQFSQDDLTFREEIVAFPYFNMLSFNEGKFITMGPKTKTTVESVTTVNSPLVQLTIKADYLKELKKIHGGIIPF